MRSSFLSCQYKVGKPIFADMFSKLCQNFDSIVITDRTATAMIKASHTSTQIDQSLERFVVSSTAFLRKHGST